MYRFSAFVWITVLLATSWCCRKIDPRAELDVQDLETYWAIDSSSGDTQYIAPVVRFRIVNKGQSTLRSVQATATFRRVSEEEKAWGSDWRQVSSTDKPLGPSESREVLLKSDARYYAPGAPEAMFVHADFRDTKVEIFLRVGASSWVSFGTASVERRIGAHNVTAFSGANHESPAPSPASTTSPTAR